MQLDKLLQVPATGTVALALTAGTCCARPRDIRGQNFRVYHELEKGIHSFKVRVVQTLSSLCLRSAHSSFVPVPTEAWCSAVLTWASLCASGSG